jgi:heat shock protein HtpX
MWNGIKTVLLLGTLSGLMLLIGYLVGGSSGLTIALILSFIMNFITYFFSDKIVLRMYNAKPLDKVQYQWVYDIVNDLAHSMNMPNPKLWLLDTPMANAFATGRNPQNASVAVTTAIMKLLDRDELRGVLAHELAHVKNRDVLISTIAATLATAIGYVASIMRYAAFYGSTPNSSDDSKRRGNPFFMMIVALLMPFAATLIQLAISRSREYQADETGSHYCHDPLALASALQKLQNHIPQDHLDSNDTTRAATASLFIVNPFSGKTLLSLLSTHPPMQDRIKRLQDLYQNMIRR